VVSEGVIANGATVYLRIDSDAPSTVVGGTGRVTLTANRTYYVRTTGTRTGSLSSETDATTNVDADAYATPQAALNAIVKLDCNSFIPTINLTSGTYSGVILKNLVGTDICKILGDGNSSTTIGKISSNVLQYYEFSALKISYSSSVAFDIAVDINGGNVFLDGSCIVQYNNTTAIATQRGPFLASRKHGILSVGTGITFTGASGWAVFCAEGSIFIAQAATLNFGSATVSDFTFYALGLGYIELGGATISGITPTYQKEGGGQIRLPSFGYF
jgi:hypothetical protein